MRTDGKSAIGRLAASGAVAWARGRTAASFTLLVLGLACAPVGKPSSSPGSASTRATGATAPAVESWRVELGTSPAIGPKSARITIVEFADFECPFCADVHPTLRELVERYPDDVRWVMKNNALSFHRMAEPLALFALAVREQQGERAYWDAVNALFEATHDAEPTPQLLVQLAARFELDPERYARTRALGAKHPQLVADRDQAIDLLAEGTPYFFVNGQRLPGAQPKETFEAIVEQELQRVDAILGAKPDTKLQAEPYAMLQASASPPPGLTRVEVAAPDADAPSWGPEAAPVVVHMFSDFECGFCQRVMFTLRELVTKYPGQVRIVWRNLPLPFHKNARWAARVALEVHEQKGDAAFWQLAERLFGLDGQEPEPLTPESIARHAAEAGLDAESVSELKNNDEHESSIDRDLILAESIGATGTPTFVINGYRLVGAQPLERFERLVNLALKEPAR